MSGLHVTLREATWAIAALAAAVVGLTAYEWVNAGDMSPVLMLPAFLMIAVLGAWPFLNGWRPWLSPRQQLQDCPRCGAQWRPRDEDGMMRCPACAETA